MTYPKHHEGITGRDLADDLLGLDDEALGRREAFMDMVRAMPLLPRITDAEAPGTFVIEMSALYGRHDQEGRAMGCGVLVAIREEWASTDEEWEAHWAEDGIWEGDDRAAFDARRQTDTAWYVQYGPGPRDVCRWTNCSFIKAPLL